MARITPDRRPGPVARGRPAGVARGRAPRAIALDVDAGRGSIQSHIYRRIRDLIVEGVFAPGGRLPSSRQLAEDWGLARNTILAALDQLAADGWLVARTGAGTFVADDVTGVPPRRASEHRDVTHHRPFEITPGFDLFPRERWSRVQAHCWRTLPTAAFAEGAGSGWPPLREALAAHLRAARGLPCEPEQVIVTSGARAGINLAARILSRNGDLVWVEDPGYHAVRRILARHRVRIEPVAVDAEGLRVADAIAAAPGASLAVVTPAAQFPTGHVLSAERRRALVDWARSADAFLVEDDYDSEFTGPKPPAALAALAPERTVFVGSFAKALFPSLRIGYMIVPDQLVDAFVAERASIDVHTNVPNQSVLAAFIEGGHLDAHLRRCRKVYAERRTHLLRLIGQRLSPWMEIAPAPGGLHLVARLKPGLSEAACLERAARAGLDLTPMSLFSVAADQPPAVLFGYAGFTLDELTAAVDRLAAVLQRSRRR